MLAKYWRLHFRNESGQIMTYADGAAIAVRCSPWKISSGAVVYGTTITDDLGFTSGTIADDGESEGDVQDNTTNLFMGIKGYFEVTHDLATADGWLYLFLEESDDNSNWPSDQDLFDSTVHMRQIAAIEFSATAVDQSAGVNFEI